MKIKTITVDATMTFNFGNYSNTKQTVALVAELGDDDNPLEVQGQLRRQASDHLLAAIRLAKQDYEAAQKPPADDELPF